MIRWIKSRLSMKYHCVLFWDKINGKAVCLYVDYFGDEWMAQSKFGMRIKRERTKKAIG